MANRKEIKAKIIMDIEFYFKNGKPHVAVSINDDGEERMLIWNLACKDEFYEFRQFFELRNYKPETEEITFLIEND